MPPNKPQGGSGASGGARAGVGGSNGS